MVLRLQDLPPSYRIDDDTGCGDIGTEGASEALTEYVIERRPVACAFGYRRLFRTAGTLPGSPHVTLPSPPFVYSFAVVTRSPAAAEEGLAIAPDLLAFLAGAQDMRPTPARATLPDVWPPFDVDGVVVLDRPRRADAAVVWRSGSTVAGVYVEGPRDTAAAHDAFLLAPLQQRHVERPTPYTDAMQDWTEVPLENPNLRVPIYWLGRTFRPGGGLPPSPLRDAEGPIGRGAGPPWIRLRLSYERITLSTYTRRGWREREGSPFAELLRGWQCTEATPLSLRRGHAIVYAGYEKDYTGCPSRPPDVFAAEVHRGRVVVGIDLPNCELCIEAGRGPYYSKRDMGIIARGLRLRHPPRLPD